MCQSHYRRFQVIKFKILNIFLYHVEENFGSKKCLLLKVSNPSGTNLKSYSLSSYDFKAKSICYNNLKSLKWNHLIKQKLAHCIAKNLQMELYFRYRSHFLIIFHSHFQNFQRPIYEYPF